MSTSSTISPISVTACDTIVCPDWCTEGTPERGCHGEHHAYIGEYLPATAGLPTISPQGPATFPTIGVSVGWDTIDHLQPSISLHISGEDVDEQPELHLHEARALVRNLNQAIALLEAQADA